MILLSIIFLLLGCQHSQQVKEENLDDALITKYYYKLDDPNLYFAGCLGEDNEANRKKMINYISGNGKVLTFFEPCDGAQYQVGYYESDGSKILVFNTFLNEVFEPNAGLTFFNIKGDSLIRTERNYISIDKGEINANEIYRDFEKKLGEDIPLSIHLEDGAFHLIIHPELNDGDYTPVAVYEFKGGKFQKGNGSLQTTSNSNFQEASEQTPVAIAQKQNNSILDYYLVLPEAYFTGCDENGVEMDEHETQEDRLSYLQIKDLPNGYLLANIPGQKTPLQVVLFKSMDKDVVAVFKDEGSQWPCTTRDFLTLNPDGQWTPAALELPLSHTNEKISRIEDSVAMLHPTGKTDRKVVLPRYGTSLEVKEAFSDALLFQIKWNKEAFSVQE